MDQQSDGEFAAMSSPELLTQLNVARMEQYYQTASSRFKAVTELAMLWLKSMTILSGGAVIGLLTLVNSASVNKVDQESLWWSFVFYVAALVLTMASMFFGYSGQDRYFQVEASHAENLYFSTIGKGSPNKTDRDGKIGTVFTLIAVTLAAAALVSFAIGGVFALNAARPSGKAEPAAQSQNVVPASPPPSPVRPS